MLNQEYCKNSSCLPQSLSTALAEVKETVEQIHTEVEETAELLHQPLESLNDTVPTHLLQDLLYQLFHNIRQVMAVDTVTLLLKTVDRRQLAVHATLGLEEEITEGIRIPVGRGFAGCIAASREPIFVEDLTTVKVVSSILRNKGLRSMLGVPLLAKDQVVGVFHTGTFRPRQFTRKDTQLLQLVADHVGSAIAHLAFRLPIAEDSALVQENSLNFSLQKLGQTIKFTNVRRFAWS